MNKQSLVRPVLSLKEAPVKHLGMSHPEACQLGICLRKCQRMLG